MNPYLKNTILILVISVIACMGACKKENKHPSQSNNQNNSVGHDTIIVPAYVDSMLGIYICIEHQYVSAPGQYPSFDTVIGPVVVTVSKYAPDDSSIVINTGTYSNTFSPWTVNSTQITYYANSPIVYNFLYYTMSTDSIGFYNPTAFGNGYSSGYYYTGHKQ